MRHKVRGRKFGREKGHRDLMLKNLVVSLLDHERIHTTLAKAKETRGLAERVITYGKKGTIHHMRMAYKVLQDRTLVKKVFDDIAPRFEEVSGGYTRVLKNGFRRGDCAPMAIIELTKSKQQAKKKDNAIKAKDLA
jgi:large subunit ribosomal protein L17